MRYHALANRQSIIGCLFLFFLVGACRSADENSKQIRLQAQAVSIEYVGAATLQQGDFIRINDRLFWHDSMYVFHRKSTDTVYLPTQRYIADQPAGRRPVYSYANALSCMINISEALLTGSDTTSFVVDPSRIYAGKLIVRAKGNKPVEVIASANYPLRITAQKD